MSQLKYFIYPNHGEWARDTFSYSQAVRVGDRIECSGQGQKLLSPNHVRKFF